MERKKVQNGSDENRESTQAMDDNSPTASEENVADAAAAEFDSAEQSGTVLETELAEARSRALRAQAELENFRKRIRRDMDEERRYATLPLIRDLLPVIDNLDRALSAVELDGAVEFDGVAGGLREGKYIRTLFDFK